MWSRLKQFLGIIPDFTDSEEVFRALHGDVVKRNFLFHIFIIVFEFVMVISISMRPGGPFAKPRRVTYFVLYLVLILAAAGVTWLETWIILIPRIFFALGEMSLSFCVKIWDARSWCAG